MKEKVIIQIINQNNKRGSMNTEDTGKKAGDTRYRRKGATLFSSWSTVLAWAGGGGGGEGVNVLYYGFIAHVIRCLYIKLC
jgi:hypothetical protein